MYGFKIFIIDKTEREDFAGFLWMCYSGQVQIMVQIFIKMYFFFSCRVTDLGVSYMILYPPILTTVDRYTLESTAWSSLFQPGDFRTGLTEQ